MADLTCVFKVVPEWKCNSSIAIQDSPLACNGVSDCEDGKDEQNCTHGKDTLLINFLPLFYHLSNPDLNAGCNIQRVKRHSQI